MLPGGPGEGRASARDGEEGGGEGVSALRGGGGGGPDALRRRPAPPQPAVVKLLVSFNAHHEKVVFSDMVVKVNRKGLNQRRVLLVTTRGIYNLERNKVRARRSPPPLPPQTEPPLPRARAAPAAYAPPTRAPRSPGTELTRMTGVLRSASGGSISVRWG